MSEETNEPTQEVEDVGQTEEVAVIPGVQWLLIIVGELGIREHFVPSEEFKATERIFWKAEDTADKKEGTINDVYYLYHKNDERHVCLYFKHKM